MKMEKFYASLFLIFLVIHFVQGSSETVDGSKTCFGTSSGLSIGSDAMNNYFVFRRRFKNCTIIRGNLEITGIQSPSVDMSFLETIEVITGYLLISRNYLSYISLANLRVIRGQTLFEGEYAFYVFLNKNPVDRQQNLKEIRLPLLNEIIRGGVGIDEQDICFLDTIQWRDILNAENYEREKWPISINIKKSENFQCDRCDSSCSAVSCQNSDSSRCRIVQTCMEQNCVKSCWGGGPRMCQTFSSIICHPSCETRRCRGPSRDDCCDKQCAAGCTGNSERDCLVCLHVNNNGSCENECPGPKIYEPSTHRHVRNPEHRYRFGDNCVDKCPKNLLIEGNGCVKSCSIGYHDDGNRVCVKCRDRDCDKEIFRNEAVFV